MRRLWIQVTVVASLCLACGSRATERHEQGGGPPPIAVSTADAAAPPTEETARAAYAAKEWRACAEQLTAVAPTVTKARQYGLLYDAACCYALNGDRDLAFRTLDASIAAGLHDVKHLEADTDLAGLHDDPRWAHEVAATTEQDVAWEKTLGAPQVRRELLVMTDEDQAARKLAFESARPLEKAEGRKLAANVEAIDTKNTRALKEIVAKYGWPGKSLVGADGAHAAWLLAQHADLARPLQKEWLARMKPLVESGEVTGNDYAYFYDRVALADHRKQLYGTQLYGSEPAPIEDEANVDKRRKTFGMSSLAEYLRMARELERAARSDH